MTEITKPGFDYKSIQDKKMRGFLQGKEAEIRTSHGRAQSEIIKIGILLTNAKSGSDHGTFTKWSEEALGYTRQHVLGFMHVAKAMSNVNNTLHLPLSQSALFQLSVPSISDEKREEIIEKIEAKEVKPTAAAIKNEIKLVPDVDDSDPHEHILTDDVPPEYDDKDPFDNSRAETITVDTITPDATPLKEAKPESDMTDAEWLMTIPTFCYMVHNNIPAIILRNDLLSWRTLENLGTFNKIKMAIGKSFKTGSTWTNFQARLQNSIVKHPKHWGGCVKCRAKGCHECSFTGADVTGGLTIEQLEGK